MDSRILIWGFSPLVIRSVAIPTDRFLTLRSLQANKAIELQDISFVKHPIQPYTSSKEVKDKKLTAATIMRSKSDAVKDEDKYVKPGAKADYKLHIHTESHAKKKLDTNDKGSSDLEKLQKIKNKESEIQYTKIAMLKKNRNGYIQFEEMLTEEIHERQKSTTKQQSEALLHNNYPAVKYGKSLINSKITREKNLAREGEAVVNLEIKEKKWYLKPQCSKLGYLTLVYPTHPSETAVRAELREKLHFLSEQIQFAYDAYQIDDVLTYIRDHYNSSNRPLITALFPVGQKCDDGWEQCEFNHELKIEFERNGDILVGDYVDGFSARSLKAIDWLKFLDVCANDNVTIPPWQWVSKVDTSLVLNIPNLAYFVRHVDLTDLNHAHNPYRLRLSNETIRPIEEAPTHWFGHVIHYMSVINDGNNPYGEVNYNRSYYPPYINERFYTMNRMMVTSVVDEMYRNNTIYRNEDTMIGILVDNVNRRWPDANLIQPYNVAGVEVIHRNSTNARLCGPKYYVPHDKKSINDCDCSTWIVYPSINEADRSKVLSQMLNTCDFEDNFFKEKVYWLRKNTY